jgi:hypothetical protein
MALAAALCVSLVSGTVNTFKTGPFNGSVDLGIPCNDTNISKPVSSEDLGGEGYIDYHAKVCKADIEIVRYDKDRFDLTSAIPNDAINIALIQSGADKDTIALYDRTIDGKYGAAGSGYLPKTDTMVYFGAFDISAKSVCIFFILDNETMMISALKTIHVNEAA